MLTFVELYAGLASVSLSLLGERPPVSRIGAKGGYAAAIRAELGLPNRWPDRLLLVDSDRAVVAVLRLLLTAAPIERYHVAGIIAALPQTRSTWEAARERLRAADTDAQALTVDWLVFTAGARGGVGGFKGAHRNRPSVTGFIPSLPSLAKRIATFSQLLKIEQLDVRHATAATIEPIAGSFCYLDPPYADRLGYGEDAAADVVGIAERWRSAGARVGISEARPLSIPGWRQIELTARRTGQRRRSMTQDAAEWLTVCE